MTQKWFRNVSIITAYNSYRDRINELGAECFVKETRQQLVTFYSVDRWNTNVISVLLQEQLWNLPPSCTKHHPRKLTVCIDMPVMIKNNEATECGVTNGAEGIAVGWRVQPCPADSDKQSLDTLFVKLTAPPFSIQLEGLPENVVPIMHQAQGVSWTMPDGTHLSISRDQAAVLPNFAMTDFNSQGRTRPDNVCDLQNCRSYQSVYTCLSRGSTYEHYYCPRV
ncbi:hypothetical protein B0H21DRAFT_778851 [Amylocystis lapponica]|nr:hypothetical protein B0H21DRAFT_778851 [Amylocystis lapponica]